MKPISGKGPGPKEVVKARLEKLNKEYDKMKGNPTIPAVLKVQRLAELKKEINKTRKEYWQAVTSNEVVDESG